MHCHKAEHFGVFPTVAHEKPDKPVFKGQRLSDASLISWLISVLVIATSVSVSDQM